MPKALKYLLISVGGLVALFLVALAVIAFTVDPNAFKPEIVKVVQEKKQRTLIIEGDIKLKLFPKLGIDLGKTRLSEHRGTDEFAAVDSLRLYVAWLPLLRRELVVDRIVVEGARAHLVRNADGSTNFDDLLSKEESQEVKFDIAGVRVSRSALSFDDRMANRKLTVSDFDLQTGRIRDNTHTHIEAHFRLTASDPAVTARVDIKSGLLFALADRHYALDKLDLKVTGDAAGLSGLDLTLRGDGDCRLPAGGAQSILLRDVKLSLAGTRGSDRFDVTLDAPRLALAQDQAEAGRLSLQAKVAQPGGLWTAALVLPDLTGSTRRFQVSQAGLDIEGRQGERTVKARLASPLAGSLETRIFELGKLAGTLELAHPALARGGLKLTLGGRARADLAKKSAGAELVTRLDDSTLEAKLEAPSLEPLQLAFDIAIDRLDLDRYLPPKPKSAQPEPERPIDLSALKTLNARGTLRVGELKMARVKTRNLRLELRAGEGRIVVDPVSANLYEGVLQGSASATTSASPRVSLRQNLSGIRIGPLLRDLAEKDVLEGRGSVTLDVTTEGATVTAMKRALDGTAAVKLTDGAIKGVNIAAMLRRAQSALTGGVQTQSAAATEQTDFSELHASFRIRRGVAHNDDLTLKSPLLRVAGSGDIDIGAGTLDYLAKVAVVGTLEGQGGRELAQLKGVTVPLRASGPFDALQYSLDTRALVTESARARVEEKTQAIKEKAREELLKGLFGR